VRKLALKLPAFPTYKNKKSMIYIDNLCEFLRLVINERTGGILTPQNKELVSTSELVNEIAAVNSHHIFKIGIFNWMIPVMMKCSKLAEKAFIDDSYNLNISDYFDWKYCVVGFKESIKKTED
jgi:UDP-glucose 4-epimerase